MFEAAEVISHHIVAIAVLTFFFYFYNSVAFLCEIFYALEHAFMPVLQVNSNFRFATIKCNVVVIKMNWTSKLNVAVFPVRKVN